VPRPAPSTDHAPPALLSFELVGVCLISFLALCNLTAFYDLFHYLEMLGVPASLRGLVVGGYSFMAMVLFLLVSPFIHAGNATRVMLSGIALLVMAGLAYLVVRSFWGLLALRILGGTGQFCVGAGAMAVLVAVIPPEKSGQAFGLYSVAILVAFAAVPALMDALAHFVQAPAHGYASVTVVLLPAAWIVLRIQRRQRARLAGQRRAPPRWEDVRANMSQPVVLLLLFVNATYFVNWTSLFFLMKGFARQQGIANVGAFFTVQMLVMILLRSAGGHLFDRFDKVRLAGFSFALVAAGHVALYRFPGPWALSPIALLFGIGMGMGYPAINGLMFEVSSSRFRALNANLMLFAVQAGSFLGPVVGGALVARGGYRWYFAFGAALAIGTAALLPQLSRLSAGAPRASRHRRGAALP
jgi:MFS family permease